RHAINCHSAENASNTPDFILSQYLCSCLDAFNTATQQRENWYGRDPRPSFISPRQLVDKSPNPQGSPVDKMANLQGDARPASAAPPEPCPDHGFAEHISTQLLGMPVR